MADATLGALLDPALDVQTVRSGYLGTLLDCDILSDCFLPESCRVLHPHFFAIASLQTSDQDTWQTECPIIVLEDYKSIHLCR